MEIKFTHGNWDDGIAGFPVLVVKYSRIPDLYRAGRKIPPVYIEHGLQ